MAEVGVQRDHAVLAVHERPTFSLNWLSVDSTQDHPLYAQLVLAINNHIDHIPPYNGKSLLHMAYETNDLFNAFQCLLQGYLAVMSFRRKIDAQGGSVPSVPCTKIGFCEFPCVE